MARELRLITYTCRDIGYGVEEGFASGFWGERDWTGKRKFTPLFNDEPVIYLFDDEITSDEAGVNWGASA